MLLSSTFSQTACSENKEEEKEEHQDDGQRIVLLGAGEGFSKWEKKRMDYCTKG